MELNLRGFLIRCHSPSEDSLAVVVDCSELPGARYLEFVRELQDALSDIDESYSERTQHRRTVRARYIKYVDSRRRIIRFSPYPSALLNRIKYLRAKTYFAINKFCVVIQRFKSGMYERNLYLLPYENADSFIGFISKINAEVEEINEELRSVDLSEIENVLKSHELEMPNCPRSISKVEVELVPLEINDKVIDDWAKRSPAVANAIYEFKKKLVTDAVSTIKPKLEDLVKRIMANQKLGDVKKELEEMKKFTEAIGLKSLAETIITPLIDLADGKAPIDSQMPKWLDGRIASLLENL